MFSLKNKVALVTGARRGMGRAFALILARAGAKVAVTDINLNDCQKVVQEIKKQNGQAMALELNVADTKSVNRAFDKVVKKFGRLDILVNNAGVYFPKPALELTEKDWDKTIDINLKGQFLCAQRSAKEMAKNKWGRIVNIASVASGQVGVGVAGGAHYTASKGGVLGLTETLAVEWSELGITVNAVGPGAIDTPMIAEAKIDKAAMDGMLARIPLKRMGKPEEIANLVLFLASEESSYITGAAIFIDGGWLAT